MERGSKRKAALAVSSPDTRASKRQKTPDPVSKSSPGESPDSAAEIGMRFMNQLRSAADKNGNLVATNFLTLPSRKEYPDYFEQTLMPLAIDTLEEKLLGREYPNLSALESDLRRLIQNAKDYNESSSDIFQNAERIRKLTHNFMSKNNPAHKNRNYQPQATPLPARQVPLKTAPQPSPTLEQNGAESGRRPRTKSVTQERGRSASTAHLTPAAEGASDGHERPFDGKTFQEAQEQILSELLEAQDPGGELKIFEPFANLPSRQLVEYYKVIKEPTSLKGVLKKIRGIRGRQETTGTTEYKSWDAFENDVRKIWDNARYYNEDESEISILSQELEDRFLRRLADAKLVVSEPAQPTLKLNMTKPAPLKLRLGSHKASPGPQQPEAQSRPESQTKTPTPGVSVDHSALERQKQHVQAGVNGHGSSQIKPTDPKAHSRSPSEATQPPKSNGTAGSPPAAINAIKSEGQQSQSPAPGSSATRPLSATGPMPPPVRLTNGTSPHPTQVSNHQQMYTPPQFGPDSKWRQPGKDLSDALITNVSISTNPSLAVPKPFTSNIPADPRFTHQSITVNLPSSHYILQVSPTLSPSLAAGRAYKLFVTCNGQRLSPALPPNAMGMGMGMGNGAGAAMGETVENINTTGKRSVFDAKLVPGVNKLEVECVAIATPPKNGAGGDVPSPAQSATPGIAGLEAEKVTCFVHLLR